MSPEALGRRLKVPKQLVSQLEMRERSGDIKLNQLWEAAEALNCDLIYAFVQWDPLEQLVQRRVRERALRELKAVERSMQVEDQATGISEECIRDYIARHIEEKDLWRDV